MKKPGKPNLDWIRKVLAEPEERGEEPRRVPLRVVWDAEKGPPRLPAAKRDTPRDR